jgi:hypothetical protein
LRKWGDDDDDDDDDDDGDEDLLRLLIEGYSLMRLKVLGSACAENRATTRKKYGVNSPTGSIFGGPIT